MEIFSELGLTIKDYLCIPVDVWREIIKDYKAKYSKENLYPDLNPIKIGVKKRVVPVAVEVDPLEAGVKDLLDDNVKIVED